MLHDFAIAAFAFVHTHPSAADLDASRHLQEFVAECRCVRPLSSVPETVGQRQLQVPSRPLSQLVSFPLHLGLCVHFQRHFRRYIRLGYDPRVAHPQNALEQSPAWNQPIPIRLSTALWNFLSELNPGVVARLVDNFVGNVNHGSNAEDVDSNGRNVGSDASSSGQKPWLQPSPEDALLSPPSFRCFAILLVQVRHPLLEEWKAQMRPLPAYDHINGWIASEALDGLRDVVEKALEGMLSPDESHRLNAINKDHGRAADGRKGRQYTGLRRNRRQEYGRIRIQELAALAPHAPVPVAVAADLAAAGESQSRQPSSSARKATGKKIRDSMVVSSKAALTNHDFDFESKSSQPSGVEIMSQLSSTGFHPFFVGWGSVCTMIVC